MRATCAGSAPRFTVGLAFVLLGASPIFAAVSARASPPGDRAAPAATDRDAGKGEMLSPTPARSIGW